MRLALFVLHSVSHLMSKGKPIPATVVLLVRHGVTPTTGKVLPGRRPGLHLSDDGRKQADAAAKRIAGLKRVAAIYSSPLERARETAAAIDRKSTRLNSSHI